MTPERPMASPVPFRKVIFSLSISAAKANAKIGFVESIMEELTGLVRLRPKRNRDWFITTPKNEHPNRKSKSFLLTGSLGTNRLVTQNNAVAPMLLTESSANGLI
jgi:hypothetical protein